MAYILMTKRDYFEISNGLVSSNFRDRCSNNDLRVGFKANHFRAYERQERERERQCKLYEKYRHRKPSRALVNRELQEAIEICSEFPSRCFFFKETLEELGLYGLYSSQDRYQSLITAIQRYEAVLAVDGTGGSGGYAKITSPVAKRNAFGEAATGFLVDGVVSIGAAATGLASGALQLTKDFDIRESVEVMNDTRDEIKERLKYKISPENQEIIDSNPIVKKANYALENTVGKAVNYAAENLPEDVVFYAGSALATGLELTPMGGKAKNLLRNGKQFASKGKLKPNISYVAGEFDYVYKTDNMGRIVEFKAEKLQLTQRSDRLPHNSATPGKLPGDHAGHLAGDRFGGSPELDNLVSQLQGVNLSSYKKIENKWADAIKEGKEVSVNVEINYLENNLRPHDFKVNYRIDGKMFSEGIKNE